MEALSISSLQFSYPNKEPLFNGLDWQVEEGDFVVLAGNTGSGKTTLLKLCKPELVPTGEQAGKVEVFGRDIRELDTFDSATQIGYVAQNPDTQIVCDSVWHELAFGLENVGVDSAIMRVRVAEVAYFFGIEHWIHQPTDQLSGGQKQLINLASVLALRPKILFLDEPTAQLDPIAEKNFLHALFRINRELGITIIATTHSPETMMHYAKRTEALQNGTIVPFDKEILLREPNSAPSHDLQKDFLGTSPVLCLDEISFRYEKKSPDILRGLCLSVREGTIHTLVGGNGCGKSTLLRLMAGALKPQRGRLISKQDVQQALLPQDPRALFVCDTVEEELSEWQDTFDYSDNEKEQLLHECELAKVRSQHPYDLSGGQQQMLGLVKILLIKPKLLFLDEPTKGLDEPSKQRIMNRLVACQREGATIVVATHDLTFVENYADEVSLLFAGDVAATQTPEEFFVDNLFYLPTVIPRTKN